jgi:hypothetical protein
MNIRDIAKIVVERRRSLASIIPSGIMQAELGIDGFAEALERRWIVPNTESGELSVTNDFAVIQEIERVAEDDTLQIGDQVVVGEEGQAFTGVIKEFKNGRYIVSFPDGAAPRTNRQDYADTEIQRVETDPGKPSQRPAGQPGSHFTQPPPIGSAHP